MDNPKIWGRMRPDCTNSRADYGQQNVNSAWNSVRETWMKATFADLVAQIP